MALEAAWEERLSLAEGGDGSRDMVGGTEGFFLLDGGTRGGGRDMGTGSPSRALYTRYMAWESAINAAISSIIQATRLHISPIRGTDNMITATHNSADIISKYMFTLFDSYARGKIPFKTEICFDLHLSVIL